MSFRIFGHASCKEPLKGKAAFLETLCLIAPTQIHDLNSLIRSMSSSVDISRAGLSLFSWAPIISIACWSTGRASCVVEGCFGCSRPLNASRWLGRRRGFCMGCCQAHGDLLPTCHQAPRNADQHDAITQAKHSNLVFSLRGSGIRSECRRSTECG